MHGYTSKCCSIAVLVDSKIHNVHFNCVPYDALKEGRAEALLSLVLETDASPSAVIAGTFAGDEAAKHHPHQLIEGREMILAVDGAHTCSLNSGNTKDKRDKVISSSELLRIIETTGITGSGELGIEMWKLFLEDLKDCPTCFALSNSGEIFLCAESQNDLYLVLAPDLAESVFITSNWEVLRDYASKEEKSYMNGFFREATQKDDVIGVVLHKGQLAHGMPGTGKESGRINWRNR